MDKRIIRSKSKIIASFKKLISTKRYEDLTVEDIIKDAHVARSTFYKHYTMKNDLLNEMVNNIFNHVFGHTLKEEKNHDFSKSSILDYKHYISHIFYHLHEEKETIIALFNSNSKQFLLDSIAKQFTPFVRGCIRNNYFYNYHIPTSLLLESIVQTFTMLIVYWEKTKFKETPETLTEYFIILTRK